MTLAKHVENGDTRQRGVKVETHRRREKGAPRAPAKVQVKAMAKARNEHLKHECAVERKETRKQIANSRMQHVQTAESWSLEGSVSKHEHTHMRLRRMQMNPI